MASTFTVPWCQIGFKLSYHYKFNISGTWNLSNPADILGHARMGEQSQVQEPIVGVRGTKKSAKPIRG